MAVKNKVQLITYPDSLEGNLKALDRVLSTYFPGFSKAAFTYFRPFLPPVIGDSLP